MSKRAQRRRERIKGDLSDGFGRLRSATSLAANEARHRVAPAMDSALIAVGLRKRRRRRWPWVVGSVAAAAAAAGTAGYVVWRRKNETFEAEADALLAEESQRGSDGNRTESRGYSGGATYMENRAQHMATATVD